jgi:ketosteroid isomerase-like protein
MSTTDHAEITETNRKLVESFYGFLSAGDVAGVLDILHEDIEIHEPECLPYGGVYKGIDRVKELFGKAMGALDAQNIVAEHIVADGDIVVGFLKAKTVKTGETVVVAEESIIRDGKIARVRVFQFDPTIVMNAEASAA